jgi:hypothetical protein
MGNFLPSWNGPGGVLVNTVDFSLSLGVVCLPYLNLLNLNDLIVVPKSVHISSPLLSSSFMRFKTKN